MLTNGRVIQLFKMQQQGIAENLTSDGISLWSYGWWEVARWVDGVIITRNGRSYSTTTATKHRKVYGDNVRTSFVETPAEQGKMNIDT